MCGRYTIVSKLEAIEKRFDVKVQRPELYVPNVNVCPGQLAPIICSDDIGTLNFGVFGFSPYWSEKRLYVINSRAEGDKNPENDILYHGRKGILDKPMFRTAIKSTRCLIPVDAFIEGPEKEKLSKPYVVYMIDKNRPFALAGLYSDWTNKETGEVFRTFSIITAAATPLMQLIGHHRSPVILDPEDASTWLNNSSTVDDVVRCLHPYHNDGALNAYPISPAIKKPGGNDLALLEPIGQRLRQEFEYNYYEELQLEGMGMTRARKRILE